ncbi:hypothetical protein Aperf_G00000014653 [Anoplocephala perfoliata]
MITLTSTLPCISSLVVALPSVFRTSNSYLIKWNDRFYKDFSSNTSKTELLRLGLVLVQVVALCAIIPVNVNVPYTSVIEIGFFASIRASLSEFNNYLVDEHEDDEPIQFVYELDDNGHPIVLGSGSFGTVYAGRELSREIKIAIKEIKNIPEKDLQPLIEEINLQSRLNHTNIVCYLGSVYEDGVLKILMEHVPGGSLSFLLKKIGSLRDETVSLYSSQILEGLRYLHASKIVHRDIKGDNILVNMYRGELKIADFGASKRLGGLIRKAGTVTGTMRFMAPELINASKDGYGYPADIWSFGCTVIEMVTGKLPYHDLDAYAAFYRAGYYSDHPDIPEELPEPCKAFIRRCFEIDPEKRASADELLADPYILIFHADNQGEKRKTPFSALPRALNLDMGQFQKGSGAAGTHIRTFSSTSIQTAPILRGSQQELSPLKTLDLYKNGVDEMATSTGPRLRRPEQYHSRERASYGGTSSSTESGELFGALSKTLLPQSEDNFRSHLSSDGTSYVKASVSSPISGSFNSQDNFNTIKTMDEAKKQLLATLLQSKASVLSWWVKQTTSSAQLPIPPSPVRSPSVVDSGTPTGNAASPNIDFNVPSSERDEYDLIECMFDFLIDALNGGEALQSLNRLLKSAIRNVTASVKSKPGGHAPKLGHHSHYVSTSLSFDEFQQACELSFMSVVGRILQQQQQLEQQLNDSQKSSFKNNSPGPVENAVHQLVAFIEKAWYAVTRSLPAPLRDAGQCQQKPHQMLTWIKLIADVAEEAIDQISPAQGKPSLRRTKTVSLGQRPNLNSSHEPMQRVKSSMNPVLSIPGSVSPWLPPHRRVQIKSPVSSPDPMNSIQDSPAPPTSNSPVDSQLIGAESNDIARRELDRSPSNLLVRRTLLRRNAHPMKYVRRANVPINGEATMKEDYKYQFTSDAEDISDLKRLNCQIFEELSEVTRKYNQLLQSELEKKEAYIADLERLAKNSLALNGMLAPTVLGDNSHNFSGISTGFPSLSKWLSELGIPVDDIETITNHHFDQNDFIELIAKDDLWKMGLRGGTVLRVWGAVCNLRKGFLAGHQKDEADRPKNS